ncbi:hypothetical protein FACS1894198_2420 [Clostridia bacterium]|nr:hypothetical protein FACS1894198_2420 [Clostridia bacterium]
MKTKKTIAFFIACAMLASSVMPAYAVWPSKKKSAVLNRAISKEAIDHYLEEKQKNQKKESAVSRFMRAVKNLEEFERFSRIIEASIESLTGIVENPSIIEKFKHWRSENQEKLDLMEKARKDTLEQLEKGCKDALEQLNLENANRWSDWSKIIE